MVKMIQNIIDVERKKHVPFIPHFNGFGCTYLTSSNTQSMFQKFQLILIYSAKKILFTKSKRYVKHV